ncbi:hypothetical protein PRVXH_000670 [Proteinivorax hydrogeniformans]|uniref:Uncharacterized protein n=1 Tax=Proteinivorax hydrogeniformans TaxID=1826727 RepID=A0AAU8HVF5_9FIRM
MKSSETPPKVNEQFINVKLVVIIIVVGMLIATSLLNQGDSMRKDENVNVLWTKAQLYILEVGIEEALGKHYIGETANPLMDYLVKDAKRLEGYEVEIKNDGSIIITDSEDIEHVEPPLPTKYLSL